ncbi:alpha/beta hydrolase fold [Mycolicibacterium rutilum]|uniref:Alpha/beta hydrolase fold n=2 Tax=Mycolicibacterium rutilum TaxID=370526 RepID=A0A1H6JYR8_MYCRU|nr:alpha/beta hydrolase fold domain-containing protein [Mycolicibacterium rutilum]SEH64503.1 alpha/beta hydrolase fold [Mycolicibacterium rutilum]
MYGLAPHSTAGVEVPRIADLLSAVIDEHSAKQVTVYGDSAGGGLALAAGQELVRRGSPTPASLVLQEKALATAGSQFTFILRKGQVHDWALPLLPEGLAERRQILTVLTGRSGAPWAGLLPLLRSFSSCTFNVGGPE